MAHTKDLMEDMNWLTVKEMVTQQILTFLWKVLRRQEPCYFTRILTLNGDNMIEMVPARLQLTAQSFRWRAVVGWNGLHQQLRSCLSLKGFKTQLKDWLIGQREGGGVDRGGEEEEIEELV